MKNLLLILTVVGVYTLPASSQPTIERSKLPYNAPAPANPPTQLEVEKTTDAPAIPETLESFNKDVDSLRREVEFSHQVADIRLSSQASGQSLGSNLAKFYQSKVGDSFLTPLILDKISQDYYGGLFGGKSAQQAIQLASETSNSLSSFTIAQNQKLIEQNDQIIGLLTKLVSRTQQPNVPTKK